MRSCRSILLVVATLLGMSGVVHPVLAQQPSQTKPADFEYSDVVFAKDLRAFFQTSWVETYKAIGHRDKSWDKPALRFLEGFCEYSANRQIWRGICPDDAILNEELLRLGENVISSHCDDPQVQAAYATALMANGSAKLAARQYFTALRGMNDLKHPAYNILFTCHQLLETRKNTPWTPAELEEINDAAVNAATRCMCSVPPTRAERYIRFRLIHMTLLDEEANRARLAKALSTAKNVDPWLSAVFAGKYETQQGWATRGNGYGNTVTPDGWRGLADHMGKAREHLVNAMMIDPAVPGPAYLMIEVAMARGSEGDESPRQWFVRARSAKMDDQWALDSLIAAMQPRWGGSYDEIFALGKELAASNRYDTKVPFWLMDAVLAISTDLNEKTPASLARPRVYDALKTMFEGYARSLPPSNGRNYVRSEQAGVAYNAGEYADARVIMDQLGKQFHSYTFSYFAKDPNLAISQVYAMTGQHADETRAAAGEAKSHKPDALAHFTALASACADDDPAKFYYNVSVATAKFAADFASGKWSRVQPDEAMLLWQPITGGWSVEDDKLIGVSNGTDMLIRFRPELGTSYEVQAHFDCRPTTQDPTLCELFCDHDGRTWGNAVFFSVTRPAVTWYVNRVIGHAEQPVGKVVLLKVSLLNGKLSATINDKPVAIPDPTQPLVDIGGYTRLSIGTFFPDAQYSMTVTDLQVRSLALSREKTE